MQSKHNHGIRIKKTSTGKTIPVASLDGTPRSPVASERVIKFEELTGKHLLDAVDFDSEEVKTWGDDYEQCSVVRFRLDGIMYMAIENPDDGYRSSLRHIITTNKKPKNIFPPVAVLGTYKNAIDRGENHSIDAKLIEFSGRKNKLPILTIGTEHSDEYYPSFVGNFQPENMPINKP